MADDAFALSPIAARAAQPSDEDYGAIYEAFMETARGRWFLTEYAKRNRNADTKAVLDAVARIEETLARQEPESQAAEPSVAMPDPRILELEQRLAQIAAGMRAAFDAARATLPASSPQPVADFAEALAPIRHAGQMVQGVAWTLRESGADGRICSLLDQQAKAIARAVLHPAFDPVTSAPQNAAAEASAIEIFAALDARLQALFEQDGFAFDIAAAPRGDAVQPPCPSQPKIIVPNDDFEIVEHMADDVADPIADHVLDQAANVEQPIPEIVTQDHAASHHDASDNAATDLNSEDLSKTDLNGEDLTSADPINALFDAPPASAQPGQTPTAPPEPVISLGAVIVDAALKTNASRTHADPLAPFARMTKAERIAFFS